MNRCDLCDDECEEKYCSTCSRSIEREELKEKYLAAGGKLEDLGDGGAAERQMKSAACQSVAQRYKRKS